MHRTDFIFDICVARTAGEFLSGDVSMEAFSKKYSEFLSVGCATVAQEDVHAPAEAILLFLAEIEAGEDALTLLDNFIYFRLYFDGVGRPRKMKPMFGSIEDPIKNKDWKKDSVIKSFRAFVFALRSNTLPKTPTGWRLEDDEYAPNLAAVAAKKLSVLDIL